MKLFTSPGNQHALRVEHLADPDDHYVVIEFWHHGDGIGPRWRGLGQRLTAAWRLVRYGTVFLGDSVWLEKEEARALALEVLSELPAKLFDAETEIEDGCGNRWSLCGPECELYVVRPGKVQCSNCDERVERERVVWMSDEVEQ
jgi:hypothetical protein